MSRADFSKAVEFVKNRGSQIELARLDFLMHKTPASPEISAKLFAGQRPDGGWAPFWVKDYSSLDAVCFHLAQAEQLGVFETGPVRSALNFLAERQFPDGSWEEADNSAHLAPVWVKPGSLPARLYLTANCGLWLSYSDGNEHRVLRAADYLLVFLQKDGSLSDFYHTHWLAGSLWCRLGYRTASEKVFDWLEQRVWDLAVSNLSWLVLSMNSAGIPSDHSLIKKAVSLLEHFQSADGHWSSEDGPDRDVHATLEALYSLRLCGRWK